jgi:hypothetical protein
MASVPNPHWKPETSLFGVYLFVHLVYVGYETFQISVFLVGVNDLAYGVRR